MERKIRYQVELSPQWAYQVADLPGCERLFSCIQCGMCSGICPLSIYMDFTPRRVIALVREGFTKEALSSQTIWLCASCYACGVACPQKINIPDVMYALKQEAIRGKLYPKRFPIPILAQEFFKMVKRRGRNTEFWLIFKMALRSNPLILFSMLKLGLQLLKTGRISLAFEQIQNKRQLQKALSDANSN